MDKVIMDYVLMRLGERPDLIYHDWDIARYIKFLWRDVNAYGRYRGVCLMFHKDVPERFNIIPVIYLRLYLSHPKPYEIRMVPFDSTILIEGINQWSEEKQKHIPLNHVIPLDNTYDKDDEEAIMRSVYFLCQRIEDDILEGKVNGN